MIPYCIGKSEWNMLTDNVPKMCYHKLLKK